MRSPGFTTLDTVRLIFRIVPLGVLTLVVAAGGTAQRVAILTPEHSDRDLAIASTVAEKLSTPFKVLDSGLADAAFRSAVLSHPFNMSTDEARSVAEVIGCDYFILIRTDGLRRSSLSKPDYFESFAFLYLVNGRTGELSSWTHLSYEGKDQPIADAKLAASIENAVANLKSKIRAREPDSTHYSSPSIERVPEDGSTAATGLKPPIPYKRIKPTYPAIAFLYGVQATIDVEVDIGSGGEILKFVVVRWAGFELEESVEKTVREMNWRPAMREGNPLPMRILLRYNFTKADKAP